MLIYFEKSYEHTSYVSEAMKRESSSVIEYCITIMCYNVRSSSLDSVTYTPNKISNWSLFKLIFSDQALIILKQFFAYICVF